MLLHYLGILKIQIVCRYSTEGRQTRVVIGRHSHVTQSDKNSNCTSNINWTSYNVTGRQLDVQNHQSISTSYQCFLSCRILSYSDISMPQDKTVARAYRQKQFMSVETSTPRQ